MKNCRHQFFEVHKISKMSKTSEESYQKMKKKYGDVVMWIPDLYGVRVICALCRSQRDLYERS